MAHSSAVRLPQLTLKRTIAWVSSPGALSIPVIGFIAFYPFLIGLLQEPPAGLELPINVHLYDLIGGLAAALTLLAFRLAGGVNQAENHVSSLRKTSLAWFAAAILGLATQLFIASIFGPVPSTYFESIPFGLLSSLGLMLGATILWLAVSELGQSARELAVKRFRLQNLKANLENEIREQKVSLNREVQTKLAGHIRALQEDIDDLAGAQFEQASERVRAVAVAERMRLAIDNVVRPLSLEIATQADAIDPARLPNALELEKQIKRRPFSERMSERVQLGFIFNAIFTLAFLLVFVVPSYAFVFGIEGFLIVALPATLLNLLLVWLLNRVALQVEIPYVIAALITLASPLLTAAPFLLIANLMLSGADLGLVFYLALAAYLVNFGTSLGSLWLESAFLNLQLARKANTQTRKLVGYLQNEAQISRRAMAQVVHGRIQARLQAASIKLKQATEITDELVTEIRSDLESSILDTAETKFASLSVRAQLDEMVAQWSGICELTISFMGEVESLIESSTVSKAAVVEVIREAVNNAVKHGEADEADAIIRASGPHEIVVVVRNAVYAEPAAKSTSGYGTVMLDQITDSWQIEFADGDAILTATIKVNQ
jgi:signal transduction histidine kinase